MGKIVELRPSGSSASRTADPGGAVPSVDPVVLATERLILSFSDLIATLEASHRRIRLLIDSVPDPETKARLLRDLTALSAALKDAKGKAISVGLLKPRP